MNDELNRRIESLTHVSFAPMTKLERIHQHKLNTNRLLRDSRMRRLQSAFLKDRKRKLRICCYNVHFWTDVLENASYRQIIEDIKRIDADVLIVNEMVFGTFKHNGKLIHADFPADLRQKYPKFVLCNTVPSWFNNPYGNLILIHKRIASECKSELCSEFNEEIFTIEKPMTSTTLYMGVVETRCFIRLQIPVLDLTVYGVHLDVYDKTGKYRLRNLRRVVADFRKNKTKYCCIAGDFNAINPGDYTKTDQKLQKKMFESIGTKYSFRETAYLEKQGFVDAFRLIDTIPKYTTWNGTRVDFIFMNQSLFEHAKTSGASPWTFITAASDHYPVVLDLYDM